MNVWPFIEAEQPEQHSVKRACALLEVSRAAYYHWSTHIPSARAVTDAQLTDQIKVIHAQSKGTYGRRGCTPSCVGTGSTAPRSGWPG